MSQSRPPSAHSLGLVGCHVCHQVCHNPSTLVRPSCPRCGARLHPRKPDSVMRCWALLLTAVILFIPANILPVMRTVSLLHSGDSNILGGVLQLWAMGSLDLALLVFTASILVPLLKFFSLAWLLLERYHRKGLEYRRKRGKLFRLVEAMGYWSMLDVFVVALLAGAIQLGSLARIEPLPGIIWFGLVVVLTMLASMSFDPRLLWDDYKESR